VSTGPGQTGGTGGGFHPGDPRKLDCQSAACVAAQAAVVDAGNDITKKCGEIAVAKARADAMLAIALATLGLAGTIAAVLVGAIGAAATIALYISIAITQHAVLFWLIVVILAVALFFAALWVVFSIQVAVLQGQLAGLRETFTAATHDVMTSCPNSCWGNLTMPVC
jgi:hypothetical protein